MKTTQIKPGQRFTRLTVAARWGRRYGATRWLCMCSCGQWTLATKSQLLSGEAQSCGCARIEALEARLAKERQRRARVSALAAQSLLVQL